MPRVAPPRDCPTPGGPIIRKLLAGSVWWRVHSEAHEPTAFRDTGAVGKRADPGRFGEEGRFDCQAGEYSYLYLANTKSSTIAEAYLRGPAVADPAARFLRWAKLRGRVLSRIELTVDLDLVDLRGARGLGRIGQDAWLTACDEPEYPVTQEWATALRRWAPPPSAAGLLWRSKRDNLHHAAMLFGDRVPAGAITGHVHRRLEDGLGRTLVEKLLAGFGMAVT